MTSPSGSTLAEATAFLEAHPEIEAFDIVLTDANGVGRGKILRRHELMGVYENGRHMPISILGLDITGEDVHETGLIWDSGDGDLRAWPARVVSLVVSDIPGDNPALVASGPTVPDTGSRADALAAIAAYGMKLPEAVMAHINSPAADAPHPDDPKFVRNEVHVIASAAVSLEAAAEEAKRQGIEAVILSDALEGEAREVGSVHAAIAREVATRNRPFRKPVLILSGGETTVTLRAKGKGGRNSEFLLAFAIGIDGVAGIDAMAADTDGIDGSENNAGAFCTGSTVTRMRAANVDAKAMLAGNNAWTAFNAVNDLFVPGPTGTNVNDLRAVLVR